MIAELDENGLLRVSAETPLEAYALRKYAEDNCKADGSFDSRNIMFYHGVPARPVATPEL